MKTTLAALLALATALAARSAEPKTIVPAQSTAAPSSAMAKIEDIPGLPRVLLIGDSISIGYTVPTRELLKGKANVHRIPANGGPTPNGLKNLASWLGDGTWDVIHFNWGLHDLKYVGSKGDTLVPVTTPGANMQVPLADYEKYLARLVQQLKATGAKLIWCTTTPVPEGARGRIPGDEVKYNEAAARVMKTAGIPVNDLYAHAQKKIADIQNKADVHFSPAGSKYLAEKVAAEIEAALPKK